MAYSIAEVEKLKEHIKEIIDEHYYSILHEMKKKLSVAISKEQIQLDRLEKYEKELKEFKSCHECHKLNVEKRDVETQTQEELHNGNIQQSISIPIAQHSEPVENRTKIQFKPQTKIQVDPDLITIDDSD